MTPASTRRWDRETTLVGQLAAGVSLVAFLFYFRRGDLLLYGDAVAHINIARRVIDSQTPGLLQLGTVWLPLPHLLMVPLLLSDAAWQTGIAGAIPSMLAFVLGTVGIFRLVRGTLSGDAEPTSAARTSAWFAAAVYAANPNLLYLQTTAMTESLYLAFFTWSVVHFGEFIRAVNRNLRAASSSLTKCGLCLFAACLTRYDGWFLAGALTVAAIVVVIRRKANLHSALLRFVLLSAAAPALWLAYNAIVYRNPLEFANGPYSARAIEQKSQQSHPGANDLPVAFNYFLKSAELSMCESPWQRVWPAGLFLSALAFLLFDRRCWPLLLLSIPLVFYTLSLAYSGVPIFVPVWWPFSYYNTRYGVELLPAFAAAIAGLTYLALTGAHSRILRWITLTGALVVVLGSYTSVWRAQPVSYREAWINSRSRIALETELANNLRLFPRNATLLMYLGDHVGVLQRAGIPLRQAINEGNHRTWIHPADPQGLWERALADPHSYADYVVAFDGDPVASGVRMQGLTSMLVVRTVGQPAATIYWTGRAAR